MDSANARGAEAGGLLNYAGVRRVRIELDLAEGPFVLRDVVFEKIEQRLGLLRAEVNALKMAQLNFVGGLLVNQPELQEKVPEIDTYLNAVGVVLAVFRCQRDPHARLFWLRRGFHHLMLAHGCGLRQLSVAVGE